MSPHPLEKASIREGIDEVALDIVYSYRYWVIIVVEEATG
jgi:hypothetical protein